VTGPLGLAARLEEEPAALFRFIDEHLEEARGRQWSLLTSCSERDLNIKPWAAKPSVMLPAPDYSPAASSIRIRDIMEHFLCSKTWQQPFEKKDNLPHEAAFASRGRGIRHKELEPIEGWLDMGRQLTAQLGIIEIGVQIGQNRAAGFDPCDPGERIVDAEVARVRPVAQRIHDPDLDTGKRRDASLREPAEVAGIRKPPEAEAQGENIAMLLEDR